MTKEESFTLLWSRLWIFIERFLVVLVDYVDYVDCPIVVKHFMYVVDKIK